HKGRNDMKWSACLRGILVITALAVLTVSASRAQDFCWKDSYGRGVGNVPTSCAPGQEMRGLLCYDTCKGTTQRSGVGECISACPPGFRDDGWYCRRAEYGRGAGYPWEFGDAFNNEGMMSRCQRDNGQGKCEMWGAIAYPKCRTGYSN